MGNGKDKSKDKGNGKASKNGKEPDTLSKKDYEDLLEPLQIELNGMARWLAHHGKRLVVLFEGRDTAGKGGAINAIADCLSPRQCHVVALSKPSDEEQGQWYFQRYVPHLPTAGQITLFDRSWYNRAGVEKVMGFCTDAQYHAFLAQAPVFERLLVDDGILLFKYWLCVDQEQQEKRFAERHLDPLKGWKLSPVDLKSRSKYSAYTEAREAMLRALQGLGLPAEPTRMAPYGIRVSERPSLASRIRPASSQCGASTAARAGDRGHMGPIVPAGA